MVNTAGITRDDLIISISEQDWRDVMETNLFGAFNGTKAVARQMMFKKQGRIINISSVVGEVWGQGTDSMPVNARAPGVIETEMTRK